MSGAKLKRSKSGANVPASNQVDGERRKIIDAAFQKSLAHGAENGDELLKDGGIVISGVGPGPAPKRKARARKGKNK
ncbi:MAG: hypothetical protein ABSF26_01435 [Thermoguttaceae bacterium]|jgi:hypothetical protein